MRGGGGIMAANAKTKKVIERPIYEEIKQDLLNQLERNNVFGKQYVDMVDDYMDLWVIKSLLVDDIQHRGVNIKYNNGGGQKGLKKNEAVDQRIKVNMQMLKLLSEIGIKPSQPPRDGEDDEL